MISVCRFTGRREPWRPYSSCLCSPERFLLRRGWLVPNAIRKASTLLENESVFQISCKCFSTIVELVGSILQLEFVQRRYGGEDVIARGFEQSVRSFVGSGVQMLRIYLVEDNPIIRESLIETLAELVGAINVGSSET